MQFRKRVAYQRRPFLTPNAYSVHQEALSCTECYNGKKKKGIGGTVHCKIKKALELGYKLSYSVPFHSGVEQA